MKTTYIKYDFKELEEYAKKLKKLADTEMENVIKKCLYDLANRMIARVKEETPVKEGLLRNSWQIGDIHRKGNEYYVEVINPVEYAEFVEYGHIQTPGRYVPAIGKKLIKDFVPGRYMMTISVQDINTHKEEYIKKILEKELRRILG
ncbi:MAG: HK97 gp10 family phage protein [Peptoanaerobacter stomatis]|uniref:HK97 gp10 family phage protein n=1 Tax=Peptoanaerobacter stomatis TaxID=796937 RepID=UPI003F9FEAD2